MSSCPIASADRRLRDAFHLWRRIERAYFEPCEFRVNLNGFVQEARNVTFILQKNKEKVPGFDVWYEPWRERLKADPVLRWIVESRNRITKQGDLDTESYNFAYFINGWLDEGTQRFSAAPCVPSTILARQVLSRIPREVLGEESLICLERRWVDQNLPGNELLNATGYALSVLSELIEDAHRLISHKLPDTSCDLIQTIRNQRSTYPIDAANAEDSRKLWLRPSNLTAVKYSISPMPLEKVSIDVIRERYSELPDVTQAHSIGSLDDAVQFYLRTAKCFLERDGCALPFVFACDSKSKTIINIALRMEDRVGKHIAIRQVASVLSRAPIEWAIYISEAWTAVADPKKPLFRHAADDPNRGECIAAHGVTANGQSRNGCVEFTRLGNKIAFGKESYDDAVVNIMVPIANAIARDRKA